MKLLKIKKSAWRPFEHNGTESIYINKKLIESIEIDGNNYTINMQNGSSYFDVKKIKEVKLKDLL